MPKNPDPVYPTRGFGGTDPELQRALASKGGKAAHAKGTAHEWDSDEAQKAGRKGGAHPKRRSS